MSDLTSSLVYPFDTTGTLSSNHIPNEMQILTPNDFSKFHFIVPKAAPYFVDSMKITIRYPDNTVRPLDRRDWFPTHEFIDASRSYAMPIAGSVSFSDLNLTGTIYLDYQTVGGVWVQDEAKIAEILENYINNPRVTTWDEVANIPFRFPPIKHQWDVVDMVGMSAVVSAISRVEDQLRLQGQQGLADHLANFDNPHRTNKSQVGLALVQNYGIASVDQAIAGLASDAYMTPYLTGVYVTQKVYRPLVKHMEDISNPHQTDAHQTGAYYQREVDALLAQKVGKTEVAFDSSRLGGMTPVQYAAEILQNGTAANALALNGVSYSEILQSIRDAAGSATSLNGMGLAEIKAEVLKGTAANAAAINNLDIDALKTFVLKGKASSAARAENADAVYGLTQSALADAILQGKAADSALLNGKTTDQLISSVKEAMGGAGTRQVVHPPVTGQTSTVTDVWRQIGHVYIDPTNALTSDDNDTLWFVAGGESMGDFDAATVNYDSPLHLLRVSGRRPGGALYAKLLNSVQNTVSFGFTSGTATINNKTMIDLTIWVRSQRNRSAITVTEVALGNAVTTTQAASIDVTTEPAGIKYAIESTVATTDEVIASSTAQTTVITTLRTDVETGFANLAAAFGTLSDTLAA